jgi:DNA polymerase III delta' subunit
MAFKDIAGNSRVKRILRRALQRHRLPNSLLFSGPAGVGKTTMALTVAKALNCLTLEDDACDACASCRAIGKASRDPEKQGLAPDVMFIAIEENKQKIAIDQIRLLKQMAYLRPMSARVRVFILRGADAMSEDASNSILKVLEEPPAASTLILVTEKPHLVLPTIRSRCRILEFSLVAREEIARALVAGGQPADRANLLAFLADGSMENALDPDPGWDDVLKSRQRDWDLFRAMLAGGGGADFLNKFAFVTRVMGEDNLRQTMKMFASFCRDILLIKEHGESRYLLNPDLEEALREAEGQWSLERTQNCLARTESVLSGLSRNRNLNMNLQAAVTYSNFRE